MMPLNPKRPTRGRSEQSQREAEQLHTAVHRQDLVQLNVRVPAALRKRLKREAVEQDRELAELVTEALEAYMDR